MVLTRNALHRKTEVGRIPKRGEYVPGCSNQQDDGEATERPKAFPHSRGEDLTSAQQIDYDRRNREDNRNEAFQKQPYPEVCGKDSCPCPWMRLLLFNDSQKCPQGQGDH